MTLEIRSVIAEDCPFKVSVTELSCYGSKVIVVLEHRAFLETVIEKLSFAGIIYLVSSLPQYLTRAMLMGEEQVIEVGVSIFN